MGIKEGQITINGLPISELSTGEQLKVAVAIAVATLGELKVVLVDGLETLDPENQELVIDQLKDAGVQACVTKVEGGELTILTDDPGALTTEESNAPLEGDADIPF